MSNLLLFEAYVLIVVTGAFALLFLLGFGGLLVWELLRLLYRRLRRARDRRIALHVDRALPPRGTSLGEHVDTTLRADFARPLRVDPDITQVLGVPTQVIDLRHARRPGPTDSTLADWYPLAPEEDH